MNKITLENFYLHGGAIPISDEELDHVGNIIGWIKKHAAAETS